MLFFKKKKNIFDEKLYYNELPSSVKTQLSVLKSLDIFTQRHIEDVPKQVLIICEQLNLNYEKTYFLMIAAYLHDVGKMFIPPEILQKQGKLTDEEYEIMKSHSVKGYDICMSFDDLIKYALVVRAHHESLDGSGYPDGLHGEQITYEMRILKVADVYSALKSKRQYKEEFSLRQIFEIMYQEVDSNKMDGTVVYALLNGVIAKTIDLINEIKKNLVGYQEQLEYNQTILQLIEQYVKLKMSEKDILNDKKMQKILGMLEDFDIEKVSDATKLLIYVNNNIITLTKQIEAYNVAKKDKAELEEFMEKIAKRVN